MKKRFIPATVAALALTFSAVAVPQAVAQEGGSTPAVEAAQNAFEADVVLKPGDIQYVQYGTLTGYLEFSDGVTAPAFSNLKSVDFDLAGLTYHFDGNNRNLTAAATTAEGNHTVMATLTPKDDGAPVTGTFNVTVDGSGPVITPIEDQTFWVGAEIAPIEVKVSDLTDVTLDVSGLPAGLTLDDETGQITGTPTEATPSGDPAEVTVTATDAFENESTATFDVTVSVDNTDPVIADIEDQEWEVGTAINAIELDITEVNPYTVEVEGLPEGVTFDPEAERIRGTPTEAAEASQTVTVTATDAAGNDAETTFDFTVGPDETAPVITAPEDLTAEVGKEISPIEIEVSEDAEVTVEGLPDGLTFSEGTGTISGTPTAVTEAPAVVTINAEDAAGNEAAEVEFTITVTPEGTDEDGSSLSSDLSSDDSNLGLILGGGVLAALIGVIAAIGGGFIQLPPAIANMIPFL